MLGEFLYNLSEKEAVSQPALQRFSVRREVSQALGAFDIEFQVPIERIGLLQHLWVIMATAGVTNLDQVNVEIRDRQLATIAVLYRRTFAAETFSHGLDGTNGNLLPQPVMLMPGDQVLLNFGFSAAAAGNIGGVSLLGLFLPRGTMQYGSMIQTQ